MSTTAAALTAAVIVLLGLVLLAVGLCRAAGRASRKEEQAASQDAFIGDLAAHLKAYGARVADLYDTTTKGDS